MKEESYKFADGSVYKWRIQQDHLKEDRFQHLYIAPRDENDRELYEDESVIKAKIVEALESWFIFKKINREMFDKYFNFAGYFNDIEFES